MDTETDMAHMAMDIQSKLWQLKAKQVEFFLHLYIYVCRYIYEYVYAYIYIFLHAFMYFILADKLHKRVDWHSNMLQATLACHTHK